MISHIPITCIYSLHSKYRVRPGETHFHICPLRNMWLLCMLSPSCYIECTQRIQQNFTSGHLNSEWSVIQGCPQGLWDGSRRVCPWILDHSYCLVLFLPLMVIFALSSCCACFLTFSSPPLPLCSFFFPPTISLTLQFVFHIQRCWILLQLNWLPYVIHLIIWASPFLVLFHVRYLFLENLYLE